MNTSQRLFLFVAPALIVLAGCATAPPPAKPYVMHDRARNDPAPKLPSEIDPMDEVRASETRAASAAIERARADYVIAHPVSAPVQAAILNGHLLAGMKWAEARASLGRLDLLRESSGVGGSYRDGIFPETGADTYLYFAGDSLMRWSRVPRSY